MLHYLLWDTIHPWIGLNCNRWLPSLIPIGVSKNSKCCRAYNWLPSSTSGSTRFYAKVRLTSRNMRCDTRNPCFGSNQRRDRWLAHLCVISHDGPIHLREKSWKFVLSFNVGDWVCPRGWTRSLLSLSIPVMTTCRVQRVNSVLGINYETPLVAGMTVRLLGISPRLSRSGASLSVTSWEALTIAQSFLIFWPWTLSALH